jgi:hypothetical protein
MGELKKLVFISLLYVWSPSLMLIFYSIFLYSIQEVVTGRHSKAAMNFLIRFIENEISLARGWCMKESNRFVINI